MTIPLNYFLEANLSLWLFLFAYLLLLRNETNFRLKRIMLLAGLTLSLIFPGIHLESSPLSIPSLRDVLPTRVLPEVVVAGLGGTNGNWSSTFSLGTVVQIVYLTGLTVALMVFLVRLSKLIFLIRRHPKVIKDGLYVAESDDNTPPFSFFQFVFIGQRQKLTEFEKNKILAHEAVHAREYHSADVLLINIIGVLFWFNPVIRIYKNIFVQIHEFEADARSVKNNEMNEYCNLLARVALLSADIRIANHFSDSLTLKRIQMMRKDKFKLRPWKVLTMCMIVPALFVLVSCQDQLANEVTEIAKSSTVALDIPADVQQRIDELKKVNSGKQLLVVEVDKNGQAKVESLKLKLEQIPTDQISSVHVFKHNIEPGKTEFERAFIVVEYDEQVKQLQEMSKSPDDVYNIVEQSAMPSEGMEKYYGFLAENINYPKTAREAGLQGRVFISFIVEKDGSLSNVKVEKGVSELIDAEAMRVVQLSAKWTPAKQSGVVVRQKLVLPVNFSLGS